MKKIAIISTIVLFFGLLLFKYTYTAGTDFLMIPHDSTALIIDDWIGIRKIQSLFNLNYHFYDCCSGTGDVVYFIKNPKQYSSVIRESENLYLYGNSKINNSLASLATKARDNPNYNIFTLTIPIAYNLDSVIRILDKSKYKIFLPFEYEKDFPSLRIKTHRINTSFEAVAILSAQIQDTLESRLLECNILKISCYMDEINGTKHTVESNIGFKLIFRDNNMLKSALTKLKDSGFEVVDYSLMVKRQLWLLSNEVDIARLKSILLSKYSFIQSIEFN